MMKLFSVNHILWAIYLSLLGVLLPHTAWAFHNFEPENESGKISLVAWTAQTVRAYRPDPTPALCLGKVSISLPERLFARLAGRHRCLFAG